MDQHCSIWTVCVTACTVIFLLAVGYETFTTNTPSIQNAGHARVRVLVPADSDTNCTDTTGHHNSDASPFNNKSDYGLLLQHPTRTHVLIAATQYGPNNQLLFHLHGMRLSQLFNVSYEDVMINRHWSEGRSKSSQNKSVEWRLSEYFETDLVTRTINVSLTIVNNVRIPAQDKISCLISDAKVFGTMQTVAGNIESQFPREKVFSYATGDDELLLQMKRVLHNDACSGLILWFTTYSNHVELNRLWQTPALVFNKARVAEAIQWWPQGFPRALIHNFVGILFRQNDNLFFTTEAFSGSPMCKKYSMYNMSTVDCLVSRVAATHSLTRNPARASATPTVIFTHTYPTPDDLTRLQAKNIFVSASFVPRDRNATDYPPLVPHILYQMILYSSAPTIVYNDDMVTQVGLQSKVSSIYSVLKLMGIRGSHDLLDIPMSEVLQAANADDTRVSNDV